MTGAVAALINPYPGLRPFETEQSEFFFGRETQTDELLSRLASSRFVAVIGTSGSGKSSLVRAGLIPALQGGFLSSAGSHWHIAVLRPGGDPIGALAAALHGVLRTPGGDASLSRDMLEITLMRSSLGLVEATRQASLESQQNLLIVVDQFEELFRYQRARRSTGSTDSAGHFVRLLLEAVRQAEFPLHILITMRADFLGDCSQFRDLPEIINDGLYLIPRMTRDQLRQVISGPAAVSGATVTPRLVQELLNDLGDDSDQLPVLQHALMRAWDRWRNRPGGSDVLDVDVYHAIGGMAEALSLHANEVWEELSNDSALSERQIAKRLFQCLTEKGPDNREVRRPTRFAEICQIIDTSPSAVKGVIERFREEDRAFLMPPRLVPLEDNSIVDISHESLIRKWDRLRTWVEEEAQSRATYVRLAEAARLNRRGETGLWRNPELQLALDWRAHARPNQAWAECYEPDFPLAMAFLDQSVAAWEAEKVREAEAREREAATVRSEKARRKAYGGMAFALLLAGVFAWLLVKNHNLLRETNASRLATEAALLQTQNDAALSESVLLAIESMRKNPSLLSDDVARRGLALLPKQVWRNEQVGTVNSVAFSPDGKYLASGDDKAARIFDIERGKEIARLDHPGRVFAVAFSPDGRYLATAGEHGVARVMRATSDWRQVCEVKHEGAESDVNVAAFSPDGRYVATGSYEKTRAGETGKARVTEADTCKEVASLTHEQRVVALAFSPDGRFLLTGSFDHSARLMETATGYEIWRMNHGGNVYGVAFSPDGRFIATASAAGAEDGATRVADAASGREISHLLQEGAVFAVAFSPDSQYVATASADRTARVMRAETGKEISRLRHQNYVTAVAFYPDGRHVATASDDNTARVMEAATGREISRLPHEDQVRAIAVSGDGRFLATGTGADGHAVRLVADTTGKEIYRDAGEAKVIVVRMTADGQYVAVARSLGAAGRDIIVSNVATGEALTSLPQSAMPFDVALNADGRYLAIGNADGVARVVELSTGREVARVKYDGAVMAVALSPDGKYLATGGSDTSVRLVEVASGKEIFRRDHQGPVMSVAFSRDGRYLATGGADKASDVIEIASKRVLASVTHQDSVVALAFSNDDDSRFLAIGQADGTLRVIDAASGRRISQIPYRTRINTVAFDPGGAAYVAAGGEDGSAHLIEANTGREVSVIRHQDPVTALAFSSKDVLATFAGYELYSNVLRTDALINHACQILARNLTPREFQIYVDESPYRKTCPNLP